MLYRSASIAFGLRLAQKTKPCFVTLRTFFSKTAGGCLENTDLERVGVFETGGALIKEGIVYSNQKTETVAYNYKQVIQRASGAHSSAWSHYRVWALLRHA